MAKVKLSKKEKAILIGLIKEKEGAISGKLQYFKFLDAYDRDEFPENMESELEKEVQELQEICEKLGEHLKED